MIDPALPAGPSAAASNESQAEPGPVEPNPADRLPASPPPTQPGGTPPVQYKGGDLDAARGPGLGCFYVQLVLLVVLLVLTPITVQAGWPPLLSMALLVAIIVLLLFAGQTMIFLLRLVAAERGRRRPRAARTRTVGDIEDQQATGAVEGSGASAGSGAGGDGGDVPPPVSSAGAENAPAADGSVRE